jgi:hypothetical protein
VTSRNLSHVALALGVVLSVLGIVGRVQANDANPPASEAPTAADVIEVTVVGRTETLPRVRDALSPQSFAPATLRWLWSARWDPSRLVDGAAGASEVRVRCWLVLSDLRHAHLYFADQAATRFLIRDLDLTGRLDELDREALSQALELSIRAMLEDHAGIDRDAARSLLGPRANPESRAEHAAPIAPAASSPGPRARSDFFASVAWQLEGHSRELGAVQGPVLALGYERLLGRWRAGLWVSGGAQLPETYLGSVAGLALQTFAFRSGARWVGSLLSNRAFAGALLSAGADYVRFAARAGLVESSVALAPQRSTLVPVLCGGALLGAELTSHARLSVALLASVPLLDLHYDVEVDGLRERVVSPWLVRPGLSLALELH